MDTQQTQKDFKALTDKLKRVRSELAKVIVGQDRVIGEILIALLAGGHCLLEGVPGLAKTKMLRGLATVIDLPFKRIQFTPDLMPADIIGTELLNDSAGKRHFEFQKGPVFTSMLLADEINRTPPKTQSALLEAMEEHAVTFAGDSHKLPEPFFVMATQNPLEQAGTYPLPEAQLDRFLLNVHIDYPSADEEIEILNLTTGGASATLSVVATGEDILALQVYVREVVISEALLRYASELVRATRPDPSAATQIGPRQWIRWGAGPRAGQALVLAAKAAALVDGRMAVTPKDIERVCLPVLRHRIILNYFAEAESQHVADVVAELLQEVVLPSDPLSS